MWRLVWFALAVLACATAPVAAQTPNPVMEHYRAYRAALAAGDLARAETEAVQALDASEHRDGDGGRTAVLALNLAIVRLQNDHVDEAVEPARRALSLAERDPGAGVDVPTVRIVSARAELRSADTLGSGRSAATRLRQALDEAAPRADLMVEIYAGAVDLAIWTFAHDQFAQSATAWTIAERNAEGATIDPAQARAYANIGIAAGLIMDAAGVGLLPADAERARASLDLALRAYAPLARGAFVDGHLTAVQNAYAQALAWRGALRAKVRSDHVRLTPEETEWFPEVGPPIDDRPACNTDMAGRPGLHYPDTMLHNGGIGAVVLHVQTDEEGRVIHYAIVAAVGSAFADSIEDVPSDWRLRRLDDSPANCRMAMSYLSTVVYQIR